MAAPPARRRTLLLRPAPVARLRRGGRCCALEGSLPRPPACSNRRMPHLFGRRLASCKARAPAGANSRRAAKCRLRCQVGRHPCAQRALPLSCCQSVAAAGARRARRRAPYIRAMAHQQARLDAPCRRARAPSSPLRPLLGARKDKEKIKLDRPSAACRDPFPVRARDLHSPKQLRAAQGFVFRCPRRWWRVISKRNQTSSACPGVPRGSASRDELPSAPNRPRCRS